MKTTKTYLSEEGEREKKQGHSQQNRGVKEMVQRKKIDNPPAAFDEVSPLRLTSHVPRSRADSNTNLAPNLNASVSVSPFQ